MSTNYKVEQLPSQLCLLGEGPHWDDLTQNLYFIDIYGGTVNRYCFTENKTYSANIENEDVIGFIVPVEGNNNEFVVGIGRRIGVIHWDGKSKTSKVVRIVGEVEKDPKFKTNRFNDGKCDRFGRIYAGTMRLEECGDIFDAQMGSFYKYAKDTNNFEKLRENISVSNGLCWNDQLNKFYYIDSCTLDVKEFDYDPKTGRISNERQVIDFRVNGQKPSFVPDGMTIDSHGMLYVATWGGSKILKVHPKTGKVELEIKFPVERITSAAFGGPKLDILFVTSAGKEGNTQFPAPAGALFKVTGLNTTGTKMYRAKV